jgi:type II secretory pathway pseudopilin PulG
MAVLALIALLTGLMLGAGRRAGEAGRIARAKAELAVIAAALENYQRTLGDYPQTDDSARLLQSLLGRRDPLNTGITSRSLIETARFTTVDSRNPLTDVSAMLADPWGRPYRYAYRTQLPWSNSGFVLYSPGPDGRDSGVLLSGGYDDPAPPENADNIYAEHN